MDLVNTVRKEGSRGGRGDFKWTDVQANQHRENYLGHSLMAPVGRWQKGKDLQWYSRNKDSAGDDDGMTEEERARQERQDEIARIKQAEREAMNKALGYEVNPDGPLGDANGATGANATVVVGNKAGRDQEEPEDGKSKDRKHRRRDRSREREGEHRHRRRRDHSRSRSRSREHRRRDDRHRRSRSRDKDRPRRHDKDDNRKHRDAYSTKHSRQRSESPRPRHRSRSISRDRSTQAKGRRRSRSNSRSPYRRPRLRDADREQISRRRAN